MIIYLYIKQHSITGLKYFGKTTRKDPFKYRGSGMYWQNHINKYGKEYIKTLEIWGFDDINLCSKFALKFSKNNNIVESKEWANLQPENGIDGWAPGVSGYIWSEDRKKERSKKYSGQGNPRYGKTVSENTKDKMRYKLVGKMNSGTCKITREKTKDIIDFYLSNPTVILPTYKHNYKSSFCKQYSEKFGLSFNALKNIINGHTIYSREYYSTISTHPLSSIR